MLASDSSMPCPLLSTRPPAGLPGYYRGIRTKIVQSVLAAALLFVAKEKITGGRAGQGRRGGCAWLAGRARVHAPAFHPAGSNEFLAAGFCCPQTDCTCPPLPADFTRDVLLGRRAKVAIA